MRNSTRPLVKPPTSTSTPKSSFDRAFQSVADYTSARGLVPRRAAVLIALSGGPDSVFLTECLLRLRQNRQLRLRAFHLNHRIRQDSLKDADWVRAYCRSRGIDLTVESTDIPGEARRRRLSLEEAGREVRYSRMQAIASKYRLDYLATGHTQSDLAETVLMRLLRGTGLTGLHAIAARSGRGAHALIRPLLCLTAAQVRSSLKSIGIRTLQDPSNHDPRFLRNQIRRGLLPRMAKINPAIEVHLAEIASDTEACLEWLESATSDFLSAHCRKTASGYKVAIGAFRSAPAFLRGQILLRLLEKTAGTRIGYRRSHIQEIQRWIQNPPKDCARAALTLPNRTEVSLVDPKTIRIKTQTA